MINNVSGDQPKPSTVMGGLGIRQRGDRILEQGTIDLDLPIEGALAKQIIEMLLTKMKEIATVHNFAKGMGIAAPQIGIDRSVAIVHLPDHVEPLVLLNPQIVEASGGQSTQYEGCLSFFDYRGLVPRPNNVTVTYLNLEGAEITATFSYGEARLIHHEIDHLNGILYTQKMSTGTDLLPVEEYKDTGHKWTE